MLKSMNFLRGKSCGRVGGGGGGTSTCNVILRRYSLLEVPWRRIHNVIAKAMSICVAVGNKVVDTRLPQPAGCGDKYDVSGLGSRLLLHYTPHNDGASNGEGLHCPWSQKILGTGPSMTGARGAGFVRLLCCTRNDGTSNGEGLHRPWCDKILGTRPRMTGGRGANFFGRSMIEMLGVLAIIGVLSVGGIAGYSKAMEQFKVNKAIDEYTALTYGVVEHLDEIRKSFRNRGNYFISDFLTAVNLIPDNWQHNGEAFKDSYGNHVQLFYSSSYDRLVYDIYIGGLSATQEQGTVSSAFSAKFCMKLFENLVIPLHSVVQYGELYRSKNGIFRFAGDTACNGESKCSVSYTHLTLPTSSSV